MIAQKQKFEFLFGLKVLIQMFTVVEEPTTMLQKKSLFASEGVNIVRNLIADLEDSKSDDTFEDVLMITMKARDEFNTHIPNDEVCRTLGYVDELEE